MGTNKIATGKNKLLPPKQLRSDQRCRIFFSLEKILKALTHSFSRVAVFFFFPAQLFDDFGKNNGYFFISAKNKQFLQK